MVLKWEDIDKHLSPAEKKQLDNIRKKIFEGRAEEGKEETEYVVVGHDWPMYEETWQSIERWVDGVTPKPRVFPIMADGDAKYIPWHVIEPHEKQALKNHGQSLQKLASRGGLGPVELAAVLQDKDYEPITLEKAWWIIRTTIGKAMCEADQE
jgi:hypothetical protein